MAPWGESGPRTEKRLLTPPALLRRPFPRRVPCFQQTALLQQGQEAVNAGGGIVGQGGGQGVRFAPVRQQRDQRAEELLHVPPFQRKRAQVGAQQNPGLGPQEAGRAAEA